jgi:hypothetical protein
VLNELERKLTALVGEALATRNQVDVTQTAGAPPTPAAGRGAVAVGLRALSGTPVFSPDELVLHLTGPGSPASVRVAAVGFEATLALARTAASGAAADLTAARTLLLEDASLLAHALNADDFGGGGAFAAAAPDPGFEVRTFGLTTGALDAAREAQTLRATLDYAGSVVIWPPATTTPEGTIVAVDPIVEALPLTISTDDPVVIVGGSTTVRIGAVTGRRLQADLRTRGAPQLSLAVISDLPPADRGAIASGTPGPETGSRLVPVTPKVAVAYQAPTGNLGSTRSELVAVHLARADGTKGALLGSVAIHLAPGGP